MPLGAITMTSFGILRIFGEKTQKNKNWNLVISGPTSRRGAQKGTPQVRYGVALLRRGVDTVHYEKNFGFLFSNTSYLYTDSLRTSINY